MASPIIVATIALQGTTVGVSGELAVRSLFRKNNKSAQVRFGKFILGLFMAIKTILFLSFHASQGATCHITGRLADLFYQAAMTAGNHVLVCRVQSIIPIDWRKKSLIFHITLTVLRFMVGMVDVALIHIANYPDGTCEYTDEEFWGPVYTIYDTLIDLYVTIMISAILISHIRSLLSDRMKVNKVLYTSVIYHNVIRSVCLTIVNLISAIFIITKNKAETIMLLWPIINIFFVVLVGYDSDVTKTIRKLQQKRWRPLSNMTSTIDLTKVPSFRPHSKRPLSASHSDPEIQSSGNDIPSIDEYDISSVRLGGWRASPNPTTMNNSTQHIPSQNTITIVDNHQSSRRMSVPNVTVGTTSCDTDYTRIG